MSCSLTFKLMAIIVSVTCDISIGDAKRKTRSQFSSQESQYFDFVKQNHSILVDYFTRGRTKENVYVDGNSKKESSRHMRSDLPYRSLCPWTVRWDEDEERVPQFIPYAECQQKDCNFKFAELDGFTSFELEIETCCEPVTTTMFSIKDEKYNLLKKWPIACICAKRRSREPLSGPSISDTQRTQQEMTSHVENVLFQKYESQSEGYYKAENPNIYIGVENPSLSAAQQERFLRQETLKKHHSESFEDVMKKQRSRKLKQE
ncbi:uncharacterized protein LOC123529013 isoform X2 [Mercenaria mercenaria]|uniref:uncharacterized protein LOC123529013 isoform X2 n=1 Tax=Mercenaria mercenaria TaxID=6596 RepID=UPI001E1D5953|nr:uncharacterized protein LOC123529013 isoform X2 [Mercenaria mercenaria]